MPGPSCTNSPHPNKGGHETRKEYIQRMIMTNPLFGILKLQADWHIFSALSSAKKARVVSEVIPDARNACILQVNYITAQIVTLTSIFFVKGTFI